MKNIIIEPSAGFPLMKVTIHQASQGSSGDFREFSSDTAGIAGILKSTKKKIQKDDVNVFASGGKGLDEIDDKYSDDIYDNIIVSRAEYSDSDDDQILANFWQDT